MKQLYNGQKHTTYNIHKTLGLGKDCLYKYIRKEHSIDNMPLGIAIKIANYEQITVEELYKKCKENRI